MPRWMRISSDSMSAMISHWSWGQAPPWPHRVLRDCHYRCTCRPVIGSARSAGGEHDRQPNNHHPTTNNGPMIIALVGYGKMGKAIEEVALSRGHQIGLRLNAENAGTTP